MNWNEELYRESEKPLDRLVEGYSNTSIFRKIAFVGDSLSSGEFETCDKEGNRGYHDLYEYSWGQYIARKNGLFAYNFSRGGMTAREYMDTFAEERCFWDKGKACQAYVIAMGVNDLYGKNTEIGSVSDIDKDNYKNNKQTYIGDYAAIVQRYKKISPDAKFFFVTVPREDNDNNRKYGEAMVKAMYDLAEFFDNAYVIDIYNYGPYIDDKFKENYFLLGHMNPMGYILFAKLVDSYIDYIIRHNPKDFLHAGLIGSGIQYKFD